MEQIKRAIIMAAGEGQRLRPVTLDTPKPLVKVNGVRFVDTIIGALKANDVHEIYIVTGYKKEQFYEVYKNDPDITIIENHEYHNTNTISSIYAARDYLPGSFIIEGDLLINNTSIFDPMVTRSGYLATFMEDAPEWKLTVEDGRITSCDIKGGGEGYRLWGVSMWTRRDGEKLAELVRKYVEELKNTSIYWDQIALFCETQAFDLGVRDVDLSDILEIDTYEELIEADSSYIDYQAN